MAVRFPPGAAGWGASRALHAPPQGPTLSPDRAGWIVSCQEQAHLLGGQGCPARAAADSCGAPAGGSSLQRRGPTGQGGGGGGLGPRPAGGRC